jgi:hypothetical protein
VEKLLKTVAAALVAAAAAKNKSPEVATPVNNAAKAGAAFVQLLTASLASGAQPAPTAIFLKSLQELFKKLNEKGTPVEIPQLRRESLESF